MCDTDIVYAEFEEFWRYRKLLHLGSPSQLLHNTRNSKTAARVFMKFSIGEFY
jgi:hypothetical protein